MRRIVTAVSAAALALSMVAQAIPANAVAGYDSAYAGESAFLTLAQGSSGTFTVFFLNTGTTTWTKGTSTQVDLAACLEDKVTCNAQDASEAPFNSGWLSATRYASTTQTSVAPGQVGTFTYNVAVPAAQAAATYRFNGAVRKADTGEDIHNEGYFQDVLVTSAAVAAGLAISPASDTNQVGTAHTVTVTYTNAAGTPIANASIDFFVVVDSDPFNTDGTCKRDTDNIDTSSSGTNPCEIDITDPITNSDGKATFTWQSTTEKETHRVVAWTGSNGEDFDNDTTTLKVSATKTWIGAVIELDCTPEFKNNPFASTHTFSCQLEEADFTTAVPHAGQTIRFELYRGGNGNAFAAVDQNGCAGLTVVSVSSAQTNASGKATFSYTGPPDPSTSSGSEVLDCLFVWYDVDADGLREAGDVADTFEKDWLDTARVVTFMDLSDDDGNPVSTTHSVTVTVFDQYDDPVANVVVRFSVTRGQQTDTTGGSEGVVLTADRTTGSDGKATFAYTGPSYGAEDFIDALHDANNDGVFEDAFACCARKNWAPEAAAGDYTGRIMFCDKTNDTIYVRVFTGPQTGNRRFIYDASDQFFLDGTPDGTINGTPTSMETWESKCTGQPEGVGTLIGEEVTIKYAPGGVSQLENETDGP